MKPLSLAWAAASPKCFAGKSPQAGGAADATGFLLTVIKSLANGSGRKNSHDEDLCWAPIPDLICEGLRATRTPLGPTMSRCRGAGGGGVQETCWELGASGRVVASSVLTAALGQQCYYFSSFSRFSRCSSSGPERPGCVLRVTQLVGDGWERNS